ncbi:MAG: hypothetical protein WBE90_27070, partial [Xanthobacteraceae bacterium]
NCSLGSPKAATGSRNSMLGVIAPDLIGMGDLDKIPAGAEPDRYRFASHTVVLTPSEPLTRRLSTAYDITPRRRR